MYSLCSREEGVCPTPDTLCSVAEDHGSPPPPPPAAYMQNVIHTSSCKHTTVDFKVILQGGGLQGWISRVSMSQHLIHVVFLS